MCACVFDTVCVSMYQPAYPPAQTKQEFISTHPSPPGSRRASPCASPWSVDQPSERGSVFPAPWITECWPKKLRGPCSVRGLWFHSAAACRLSLTPCSVIRASVRNESKISPCLFVNVFVNNKQTNKRSVVFTKFTNRRPPGHHRDGGQPWPRGPGRGTSYRTCTTPYS